MKMLELYFSLKLMGILLLVVIILGVALLTVINSTSNSIKSKILLKNGFVYERGLGYDSSSEFQPRFIKNNKKIMERDVFNKSFKELKKWINE